MYGKEQRSSISINENGETFSETIVVDTEKGTEIAYVPEHEKRDVSKVLTDFTQVSYVVVFWKPNDLGKECKGRFVNL